MSRFCTTYIQVINKTRKCGTCDALQLEAALRPACHSLLGADSELDQAMLAACYLRPTEFLLLIRYVTL